ncbi:hypothetical protein RB595_005630 [Gaeumannomyces hyphopodioides]
MLLCSECGVNFNVQPSLSPQRPLERDPGKAVAWVPKDRGSPKLAGQGTGLDGLDNIAESGGTLLTGPRDRSAQSPDASERHDIVASESRLSLNRDGLLAGTIWKIPALLDLTDSVRWWLATAKAPGPMESRLKALLDVVLANEALKASALRLLVDLETIRGARLDKLIEALLDKSNQPPRPVPASFFAIKTAAGALQRKWRQRFREAYISLDRVRYHRILTSGHLVEVSFNAPVAGAPGSPALWWNTRGKDVPTKPESNRQFHAGQYKIVQYGHKLNEDIEVYRLALVLERVPGQRSMEDLKVVPKPSQLDDWRLYERLEGEKLKSMVGRKNFLAWKTKKVKDKLEYEQWLISVGLKTGYPHWRTTIEDDIKQKETPMQGRRQAISSR